MKHLVKARERQRKKRGLKRRYRGTLSYKLESHPELFAKIRKMLKEPTAAAARAKAKVMGKKAKAKKA